MLLLFYNKKISCKYIFVYFVNQKILQHYLKTNLKKKLIHVDKTSASFYSKMSFRFSQFLNRISVIFYLDYKTYYYKSSTHIKVKLCKLL